MYVASGVVVYDLVRRSVKWTVHLDLSTDHVSLRCDFITFLGELGRVKRNEKKQNPNSAIEIFYESMERIRCSASGSGTDHTLSGVCGILLCGTTLNVPRPK